MSHLGRRLTALVDGELSPADRDRAHAHLARCAACRAEAKELRELKRRLRGLADLAAGDELTQRLIAIPGPGGPRPVRLRRRIRYVGGGPPAPGPRVTPPVGMYSVEHAITTGQIPVGGTAVVPVPALTGSPPHP